MAHAQRLRQLALPAVGLPRTGERATHGPLPGGRRHPQNQARHRHRTGEPVVRQRLRDLPGRGRHPAANGAPTVCLPVPTGGCQAPYHDTADVNEADRTTRRTRRSMSTGGRWTVSSPRPPAERRGAAPASIRSTIPRCSNSATPDVMGYHTAAEIPNDWTYAKDFTLDDHMFEPVASWSLPDHLYLVSGWSAKCSSPAPSSCVNEIKGALHAGADAEVRGPGHRHRYGRRDQRVDRHHLALVQQARLVGLLRPDRRPAGLRRRRRSRMPSGGPELPDPGHLEPVRPSSRMCKRTTRSATSSR